MQQEGVHAEQLPAQAGGQPSLDLQRRGGHGVLEGAHAEVAREDRLPSTICNNEPALVAGCEAAAAATRKRIGRPGLVRGRGLPDELVRDMLQATYHRRSYDLSELQPGVCNQKRHSEHAAQ